MSSIDSASLGSASNDALRLQDFLGEWQDSMGHQVRVSWARPGNRAGELDVQLLRSHSNHIRLNVKALDEGQFQCGHFQLKVGVSSVGSSSVDKIVWADNRVKGKVSVWERAAPGSRTRSRSRTRSPIQRQQKCGCVMTGKVALRCIDHLPPQSVLHDISTPGAWAPPTDAFERNCLLAKMVLSEEQQLLENAPPVVAPEVAEKLTEVDRLLEAYDQSLEHAATTTDMPPLQASPDTLHEAKAKLLAKHPEEAEAKEEDSQAPLQYKGRVPKEASSDVLHTAKAQLLAKHLLVPEILGAARKIDRDPRRSSQDPRLRRVVVAPTGGA